jgi:hypothetical protein
VRKIIATCKHYAAYDLEDWKGVTRHNFNAKVSLQDLSEYYLPPFQQCARDSKVGSIMCSYNEVNGVPACANTYLMTDILRGHWGWVEDDNYITSDCDAVEVCTVSAEPMMGMSRRRECRLTEGKGPHAKLPQLHADQGSGGGRRFQCRDRHGVSVFVDGRSRGRVQPVVAPREYH